MRLSVVLFASSLALVYLLTPLSAESPGRPEEGWIESFRVDAARQSIIARWSATVGRENIYLTFREDGTVRLAACRTYEDSTCSMGFAGVTIFQE